MREALAGKHRRIAEEEIEIIAKQAKLQTNRILAKFKQWHEIIEKIPTNIEELNEIREFMSKAPIEIKKLKSDMEASFENFEVLNEFGYKFKSDDDFE
jgi:dynein heavy chain, axonemal